MDWGLVRMLTSIIFCASTVWILVMINNIISIIFYDTNVIFVTRLLTTYPSNALTGIIIIKLLFSSGRALFFSSNLLLGHCARYTDALGMVSVK